MHTNPIFSIITIYFLIIVLFIVIGLIRRIAISKKVDALKNNSMKMRPEEFFKLRNMKVGGHGRKVASQYNFTGVYVLYNQSKNMYYVGQAKKILDRVNAHFTGHGNGDVYADYKYGDSFEISMIALENSGFRTLNELERCTIKRYNAFSKGYNRTRGNRWEND